MKGVVLSIRRNCPFGAIGVQGGQSPKNNEKKEDSRNQPPETGRRIVRLLYAYERLKLYQNDSG